MNRRSIILVIISVVALIVISFVMYKQSANKVAQPLAEQVAEKQSEPERTEFGTKLPTDFPTDIPIEEGAEVEQSYSLNYTGQKQMTIVFASTKTVKENYSLYADFLEKQQWNVSNKYESAEISSLYGTKDNNDINITINENTTAGSKSQVSISVLKK